MHRISLRKTSSAALLMGGSVAATSALADAPQGGYGSGSGMGHGMMGGYGADWMGGGYGGLWLPILLVAVIAGLMGWIVARNRK
jgi:hypothetical protein